MSLAANALLLMTVLISVLRQPSPAAPRSALPETVPMGGLTVSTSTSTSMQSKHLGERRQLNYDQWLNQLKQEAKIVADQQPAHLTVLAGDSISLWFPNELLPRGRNWLNQGISGETSSGLLKRLDLFEQTEPETIFVMIGINDLLKGASDQMILDNQRQIINRLDDDHPGAQIVVQSILPHAQDSNWEGRDKLLTISNSRIQELNKQLEAVARQAGVYYLDLYPLFANRDGNLRPELSTDGLHLSPQGYQTWSIALQVYSREVLELED